MNRATVHVDLANKSCVVSGPDTVYGAWAPGITRRTAEAAIATDGWRFVPSSTWQMTIDGGTREVEQDPVTQDDDLLDLLGCATSDAAGALADDELAALLLAWRNETENRPIPGLIGTSAAVATILRAQARKANRDSGEQADAVREHTVHSATAAARLISATVAAEYDPHAQAHAEQQQADHDITTTLQALTSERVA